MTIHDLVTLHALQGEMAIKRNWVAVGHLQALIEEMATGHEGIHPAILASVHDIQVH